MAQLRAVVQAPTPRPPAYGLIAAAPVIEDPELRWAGGWEFQPEGCGIGGRDSVVCAGNTGVMEPERGPDNVVGDPIWIWGGDACSAMGSGDRDWQGRARRQLQVLESYELAAELWDGTVTTADSLDNRFLAGAGALSDTVTNGPTAEVSALACLEQALATGLKGAQGMVHMTNQLLVHLAAADVLTRQGNLWITPNGNIVVADAGYSGAGPGGVAADADSQWIYGTPIIQVRLGPVEVIPGSLDSARQLAAAMDRGVNDIVVLAGRLAGFQWASECVHAAAQVDVGVCLIGGAS